MFDTFVVMVMILIAWAIYVITKEINETKESIKDIESILYAYRFVKQREEEEEKK